MGDQSTLQTHPGSALSAPPSRPTLPAATGLDDDVSVADLEHTPVSSPILATAPVDTHATVVARARVCSSTSHLRGTSPGHRGPATPITAHPFHSHRELLTDRPLTGGCVRTTQVSAFLAGLLTRSTEERLSPGSAPHPRAAATPHDPGTLSPACPSFLGDFVEPSSRCRHRCSHVAAPHDRAGRARQRRSHLGRGRYHVDHAHPHRSQLPPENDGSIWPHSSSPPGRHRRTLAGASRARRVVVPRPRLACRRLPGDVRRYPHRCHRYLAASQP